jgi:uncharacterized protein (TIGR03083 family)
MDFDRGASYRDARLRITELVDDEVAAVPVPATPGWDVHDVVAHLAGIVEDAVTGNMEGVTTDPWTAAQVERGRTKTVRELVEQWDAGAPLVEAVLTSSEGAEHFRAVLDVHCHEADLRHALGHPPVLPDAFLDWAAAVLLDGFGDAVAEAGLPPVTVEATRFEVFRGRLGRRTPAEVAAYGWSADPGPYLDAWFIFGSAAASIGEGAGT